MDFPITIRSGIVKKINLVGIEENGLTEPEYLNYFPPDQQYTQPKTYLFQYTSFSNILGSVLSTIQYDGYASFNNLIEVGVKFSKIENEESLNNLLITIILNLIVNTELFSTDMFDRMDKYKPAIAEVDKAVIPDKKLQILFDELWFELYSNLITIYQINPIPVLEFPITLTYIYDDKDGNTYDEYVKASAAAAVAEKQEADAAASEGEAEASASAAAYAAAEASAPKFIYDYAVLYAGHYEQTDQEEAYKFAHEQQYALFKSIIIVEFSKFIASNDDVSKYENIWLKFMQDKQTILYQLFDSLNRTILEQKNLDKNIPSEYLDNNNLDLYFIQKKYDVPFEPDPIKDYILGVKTLFNNYPNGLEYILDLCFKHLSIENPIIKKYIEECYEGYDILYDKTQQEPIVPTPPDNRFDDKIIAMIKEIIVDYRFIDLWNVLIDEYLNYSSFSTIFNDIIENDRVDKYTNFFNIFFFKKKLGDNSVPSDNTDSNLYIAGKLNELTSSSCKNAIEPFGNTKIDTRWTIKLNDICFLVTDIIKSKDAFLAWHDKTLGKWVNIFNHTKINDVKEIKILEFILDYKYAIEQYLNENNFGSVNTYQTRSRTSRQGGKRTRRTKHKKGKPYITKKRNQRKKNKLIKTNKRNQRRKYKKQTRRNKPKK